MKSFNSFGVPRLPSADSIITEGLPDGISPRRNNPQLEKFRNNIRSSLFSGESTPTLKAARTQSTPMVDAKSTGDLEAIEQKSDLSELISPNNSRLDQVRNSLKGSLFLLSHKSSGTSPSHDNSASPTKALMQPIEVVEESSGAEEPIKPAEEPQEGLAGNTKLRNPFVVGNSESPESYEEDDSPVDKNDIIVLLPKQSIFLDTVDREIEELKTELKIDQHSKIHFIQGSFCKYYKEGDFLGEGTSGVVKKCSRVCTKEQFAVKIVQYKGDMEILTLIIQEFQNLLKLNHKNVVKVYELYVDYFKKKIYTIMELAECREMFEALKDLGHYSEAVASGIMKQILTGINYLHLNGVCHRDIKPNNILVSNDGQIVKITDFNVSKFLDKKAQKNKYSSLSTENYKMWTYTGTIAFTAPEVFVDSEYTERVDVWSAGVVLYTMLCGYQPFHATHVKDLIELIKEGKYTLPPEQWDSISDQAKDLIKHCLDVNCKTRYSPADALMHPWIANQVKVSDRKISFKDNFRVYYKKYTGNKKNYACAVQMKKVQVTSPHIAVASPAIRLKRRSGTNRVMELYTKGGSNDSKVLKEVNSAGEETKETCSSVLEELNEESPLQRTAFFEPEEPEILTGLNRDRSCSSEFNGRKKSQEKSHKALQEIENGFMPQTLKLRPVIEVENKRCSEGENKLHACDDNLEAPLLIQSSSIENQIS